MYKNYWDEYCKHKKGVFRATPLVARFNIFK